MVLASLALPGRDGHRPGMPLAKVETAPMFARLFPYQPMLIGILTVVEVLVCLLLILIVLMQRPRQEGRQRARVLAGLRRYFRTC